MRGRSRSASGATSPARCEAASEKRSPIAQVCSARGRDQPRAPRSTDLLSRLIQVDTTNPPGNETAAAELLRALPRGERRRSASSTRACPSGRTSSRASPAAATGRRCSSSATPTSFSPIASEWSVPPFSGEVRDGEVWGRGALDMKGQVAANAVAIASLAREGFEPAGDLDLRRDRRRGGRRRLRPLLALRRASGRGSLRLRGQRGRRRPARARRRRLLRLRDRREDDARRSSSACTAAPATRRCPGSPTTRSSRPRSLIERIAAYRPEPQMQQEVEVFLRAVLGDVPSPERRSARTRASTGPPPSCRAAARADVRADDDLGLAEAERHPGRLRDRRRLPAAAGPARRRTSSRSSGAVLGGDIEYDLEFLEAQGGTRSPLDTPLWNAVESFVAASEPGAARGSVCCAGFTDSHWLREAFGTVAYGFFPSRTMTPELAARSSTRPTSGCPSPISSSASTGCATPRARVCA